jgi:hypothetical protein
MASVRVGNGEVIEHRRCDHRLIRPIFGLEHDLVLELGGDSLVYGLALGFAGRACLIALSIIRNTIAFWERTFFTKTLLFSKFFFYFPTIDFTSFSTAYK